MSGSPRKPSSSLCWSILGDCLFQDIVSQHHAWGPPMAPKGWLLWVDTAPTPGHQAALSVLRGGRTPSSGACPQTRCRPALLPVPILPCAKAPRKSWPGSGEVSPSGNFSCKQTDAPPRRLPAGAFHLGSGVSLKHQWFSTLADNVIFF